MVSLLHPTNENEKYAWYLIRMTTSTIMEVTTVAITVAGRRTIVPGRGSKRIAKEVVSPW